MSRYVAAEHYGVAEHLVILLIVGIPALASIVAAVVAGVFGWKTRRAEAEAQRARDLESRLIDLKYKVYEPMINYLRDLTQKRRTIRKSSY